MRPCLKAFVLSTYKGIAATSNPSLSLSLLRDVMRPGPIFREVVDKFDCRELDVRDPASNQHDSNPATITPLLRWLSTKHNLIDLAKKAVPASESKNTIKKV